MQFECHKNQNSVLFLLQILHINDASKLNLKNRLHCPPYSFFTCKTRNLNKKGNSCEHVFPLSTFSGKWGRWYLVGFFKRHLKLENPHISQSTDRSERSSPVWGSAQHSTAPPPTDRRLKPGSFWGHHRPGDAATSAHFRNGNRKPLGSMHFLPSFLFRSLYAPQYFVGKAATYQHQQSSARVGNGSVRPRGWAPEHPLRCLQSTDPAI